MILGRLFVVRFFASLRPTCAARKSLSGRTSRDQPQPRMAHPSRAERGEEEVSTARGHNPNGAPEPSEARRGKGYPFLNSLIASFHSCTSLFIALMMYPLVLALFLTALLAMV